MASLVEITIKKEVILAKATKLEKIAETVSQKRISGMVSSSKGKVPSSINNLIQELNNMGTALGKLMNKNAKNVRQIADQFSAKDADIASKIKG